MSQFEQITHYDEGYSPPREVTFEGKLLAEGRASSMRVGDLHAYLTPNGGIRVTDGGGAGTPLTFHDFVTVWGYDQPDMVAEVAEAIGEPFDRPLSNPYQATDQFS